MNTLFNCSLWGDEAFSALLAQQSLPSMLAVVVKDTSPPLMYLIMWLWFKVFGHSEVAIRSLSLLFYLGTSVVIFLIAKELFKSKKTAWLAMLLTFFNPFLFPYAFEGRMYFSLLFFVVLSFYFLIKENKWGYILSAAAALYSHHFAFLVVAAQFFWRLAFPIKSAQNIFTKIRWFIILGLFYLPWLYPLYLQTTLVSSGFWLGKPKLADLFGFFENLINDQDFFKLGSYLPYLAIALLLLRRWQFKKMRADLLLVLWALIPPVLAFLVSQSSVSIFYERYLLYCVPPIMILLSSRAKKVSYPLILVALGYYLITAWYSFTQPFKANFRDFAAWVKENITNEVYLVNYNGSSHHLWESKYYGLSAPIYSPSGELPYFVGTAQMTGEDVVYRLPKDKEIGLISSTSPDSVTIDGYDVSDYHQVDKFYFISLAPSVPLEE